ncbi:unnamed protein product [Urochloa humidicola]
MDNQRQARGLVRVGIVVLTVTCAAVAYRSAAAGDVGSEAFVTVSYGALLLLLRFLRAYDRQRPAQAEAGRSGLSVHSLPPCSPRRFPASCRGPSTVVIGVWSAAAATSAGGFVLVIRQRRL